MTSSTYIFRGFEELENRAKLFSDFLEINEKNNRNPQIQDKINKTIKYFRNSIFNNEDLLVRDIGNSVTQAGVADQILKNWESLLKKCGYNDSPLDKIQKKMNSILKKGTALGQDCHWFPKEVDDIIKKILTPESMIKAIEKIHDLIKKYRLLFEYSDQRTTWAKLLELYNILKLQPEQNAQITHTISHLFMDKTSFLISRRKIFPYKAKHYFKLREHSPNDIKLAKKFYVATCQRTLKNDFYTKKHLANITLKLKILLPDQDISSILAGDFEYRLDEAEKLNRRYLQFDLVLDNAIKDIVKFQRNTAVLKEVNRWLLDNLKWFYMTPMNKYIDEELIIKSRKKLKNLNSAILNNREAPDNPILHTIKRILSCRKIKGLPPPLECNVLRFLPAMNEVEIQTSLSIIKERVKSCSLKYKVIAQLVNQQRLSLADLPLEKLELFILAKYLTYMDLSNLHWDNNDLNDFISRASSSVLWLDCSNTKITELPELSELKRLNINSTYIKSIPTKTCRNLKSLYCSDTKELKSISNCFNLKKLYSTYNLVKKIESCPRLEVLYISNNPEIEILPESQHLTSLSHDHCANLYFVPYYPKLNKNEYKYIGCPKLLENANEPPLK